MSPRASAKREIGPAEWRVLLDAGAVPRSLLAAAITVHGDQDPLPTVAVANDILALWGRPQIIQIRVEGSLGDLAPMPPPEPMGAPNRCANTSTPV
ncbi:hypothetical protein [Streptomyces sp. NPDC029674]|uniref:hypothetical protein n=1 Tax=Streptomyces sp. NPDC029674 TaxID=3365297 RepID=UPI00384C9318